ncbi:hypothetical protein ACFRSX_36865 [Streptomyces goshikiensis]|uniref:hypothetical protein n=1 Tax=Streptomyces TaxID=1883 RepID=UPI000C27B864|nr:hypothetical protein [Streptomyces sp. CB02120-2]PJN19448.1 hypothetical protein CG724_04040 [Streptomyces sp. CB02120-2]
MSAAVVDHPYWATAAREVVVGAWMLLKKQTCPAEVEYGGAGRAGRGGLRRDRRPHRVAGQLLGWAVVTDMPRPSEFA